MYYTECLKTTVRAHRRVILFIINDNFTINKRTSLKRTFYRNKCKTIQYLSNTLNYINQKKKTK